MNVRLFDTPSAGASFDVCGIGNAIVDVLVESTDLFLETHKIPKGVMSLIDETRAEYLYKRMGPGIEMSGGSVANTVAGIASLGGRVSYIGKVKDDQLGAIFCHDMRSMGVHFSTPPAKDGPSTARCLILVTPDAQRSMNTYLGACVELTTADIDPNVVRNAKVTYFEGYLFDKPSAQEAFRLASRVAHESGRLLALTLSDPFCVERYRAAFQDIVKNDVDILLANEYELMALYQSSTFEAALAEVRPQCKVVIGTRSAKGAVIASGDQTIQISAEPVEPVVDSTGAGDLFAAGFLYGLTQGRELAECGRLGAVAAAEVISHFGPRPQRSLKEMVLEKGMRV